MSFAQYNHQFFGYLSYVYLALLLAPIYYVYKHPIFSFRRLEYIIAVVLLFSSLLILQAVIVEGDLRGQFGSGFVDFIQPFVGLFGVLIFWLVVFSLSLVLLFDRSPHEIIELCSNLISTTVDKVIKKKPSEVVHKKIEYKEEKVVVEEVYEETEYIEVEAEPEPTIDIDALSVDEAELDKPSYQRQKMHTSSEVKPPKKESSIRIIKKETPQEKTETAVKEVYVDELEKAVESVEKVLKIKKTKNKKVDAKQAVVVEELEENKKLLDQIEKGDVAKPKNFELPPVSILQKAPEQKNVVDEAELDDKISDLIGKLAHFKIDGDVIRTYAGPVVSTFEFKPAANIKVSKILNLQDDLAMALRAETIRIQAPIPGKDVVGIEIPNHTVETIYLREILESKLFQEASSPLTIVLGKDIVGNPFITDLKKLPHLLIAGTTGSGKSVGINAMILSLLYKNSPDQLKLLMIDPKMLEFSIYNDIPHLLTPVITKAKQAVVALNNMVAEMERRYELMAGTRTKNIENYNIKVAKEGGENFPYIVVIIDELADLMMTSGKDVEQSIARLAQKSRACGIHLIVATQRPSVDVVTGLIKANLPSRASYRVGQKVDSKIILDQMGAESLLGRGDMLFTPPGTTGLVRLHAPWATEEEIEEIVEFIKEQRPPDYDKRFLVEEVEGSTKGKTEMLSDLDELYEEAKRIVLSENKTSISYLQRRLQIGYNRSARIIEQLEISGILSEPNAKGNREIVGG